MANLSLELLTAGQCLALTQVKGENMISAYLRIYADLNTFNVKAPLGQDTIWQAVVNLLSI